MFKSITFTQLAVLLEKNAYDAFSKWMQGQTCSTNKDGEAVVFGWDLDRWVRQCYQTGFMSHEQGTDWD